MPAVCWLGGSSTGVVKPGRTSVRKLGRAGVAAFRQHSVTALTPLEVTVNPATEAFANLLAWFVIGGIGWIIVIALFVAIKQGINEYRDIKERTGGKSNH